MPSIRGQDLLRFQPNRYPFLMLDEITDFRPGEFAVGIKNFTNNEWFFPVHFDGAPNVPGVLQIEAMSQVLTVAITTLPELEGSVPAGLAYAGRFRQLVLPGDRMEISASVTSFRRGVCKGTAECEVAGKKVSEGEITFVIPTLLEQFTPRSR